MKLLSDSDFQAKFINGIISGVNVPEMNEEDAIAKLKELGYDTSRIEASLNKDENKVVSMSKENAENNKNT